MHCPLEFPYQSEVRTVMSGGQSKGQKQTPGASLSCGATVLCTSLCSDLLRPARGGLVCDLLLWLHVCSKRLCGSYHPSFSLCSSVSAVLCQQHNTKQHGHTSMARSQGHLLNELRSKYPPEQIEHDIPSTDCATSSFTSSHTRSYDDLPGARSLKPKPEE